MGVVPLSMDGLRRIFRHNRGKSGVRRLSRGPVPTCHKEHLLANRRPFFLPLLFRVQQKILSDAITGRPPVVDATPGLLNDISASMRP